MNLDCRFKCLKCGHRWWDKPGPTQCPRCKHIWVKWVNYDQWRKENMPEGY